MGIQRPLRHLLAPLAAACLLSLPACCTGKPANGATGPDTRASISLKPNDPGVILVWASTEEHDHVRELLRELRAAQPRSYANDDALMEQLEGGSYSGDDLYPCGRTDGTPEEGLGNLGAHLYSDTVRVKFRRTPLEKVVAFLEKHTVLPYALIKRDIPPDGAPVTLEFEGKLEDVLDHVTTITGMAWAVRDCAVTIGALESLRQYELRDYPVRDLLIPLSVLGGDEPIVVEETDLQKPAEKLVAFVRAFCFEDRPRAALKPGDPGMAVLKATMEGRGKVCQLLKLLRQTQPRSYDDDSLWQELEGSTEKVLYPEDDTWAPSDEDKEAFEQLQQHVHARFVRTPMQDVAAFLQRATGVTFLVIARDVPEDGAPVTLEFEGRLSWKVESGVVEIGAPETLARYDTRIYPIRELLIPVENLRSGQPVKIDEGDMRERAEKLLEMIRKTCFEDQ
jgi:hypothetical protein